MSPEERLEAACMAEAAGKPVGVVLFWGHQPEEDGRAGRGCLSQWWPGPFSVEGVTYPTAEHWMMAAKARLFGDQAGLAGVMATDHPGAAKAVGRRVRGFDEERWAGARYEIRPGRQPREVRPAPGAARGTARHRTRAPR